MFARDAYVPSSDDEVLLALPRSLVASRSKLRELRQQLAAKPNDPQVATEVARRYLIMGGSEGDPRFYGYARAAISPWWEASSVPPSVLSIRAKLKERDHEYDQALADLKLLIEQEPKNVQAWVDLVNILRVQGEFKEASQACDVLGDFAGSARTLICRLPIMALTGKAEEAHEQMTKIMPAIKGNFPELAPWLLTVQGNTAVALGKTEQAEQYFRTGLELEPQNKDLLRNYADLLLDNERNEETIALLRDHTSDNGILLRAAIAAKRTEDKKLADEWKMQLENRFEEIRLRGSQPHGRFESRYELELNDNPRRALELALANWEKQKESRDTRNLLEAALAAGDDGAVQPALEFLRQHGTEDVALTKLVERLERSR